MKSLAEREEFRAKQRAAERAERGISPTEDGESDSFDAQKHLKKNVNAIKSSLAGMSEDNLAALAEAEEEGKKRESVLGDIKAEQDKRKAAGSGWSQNA